MTKLGRVEVMTDILSFVGGGKRREIQEKKGTHFQPSI